ncbi:ornithine-acyl-ACP acyltransferase [Westiellopsis prolifica IICB1]|nr:ornithine-acyl-ACP acyltransferase [Westiellopsis prolifica IICB1]
MKKKLNNSYVSPKSNFAVEDFPVLESAKYLLKLASTEAELESILRLRFEVFNIEKGLGLATSNISQKDRDKFDAVFHHFMLISKETGKTIGTYRLQTYTMASQNFGFYAAKEYNIHEITESIIQASVEVGRVCIAREDRNIQALLLLYKGLLNYLNLSGNQYCFGCTLLPTLCPIQAACTYNYFQQNNLMHPSILVYPKAEYLLELPQHYPDSSHVEIPNILQVYFQLGAKICSLPAIYRQFKVIDFLTILDSANFAKL